MSLVVECPGCGKQYRIAAEAAGRKGKCRDCGAEIDTGAAAPPAPQLPRQMLANRTVAGKTCPACAQEIGLGQPIRNCELCFTPHHEPCWAARGGCATAGCRNAPPPAIKRPAAAGPPLAATAGAGAAPAPPPPPPAGRPLASVAPPRAATQPGKKPCPFCGELVQAAARKCRFCGSLLERPVAAPTSGPAPVHRSGLAMASLACGITSIVVCFFGFVIGPVAIGLGIGARNEIQRSVRPLAGRELANAGVVTGAIGTVVSVILMIIGLAAE